MYVLIMSWILKQPFLHDVKVFCSSKQYQVHDGQRVDFTNVCFARIQMCTFKMYRVNSLVQRNSHFENIHTLVTIAQNGIYVK